jgi:hypothetical protein
MLAARVKGVVYRPLAEGEALGIRVAAAWAGRDEGGRYEKLAATAAKVLGGKRWREERLLGG